MHLRRSNSTSHLPKPTRVFAGTPYKCLAGFFSGSHGSIFVHIPYTHACIPECIHPWMHTCMYAADLLRSPSLLLLSRRRLPLLLARSRMSINSPFSGLLLVSMLNKTFVSHAPPPFPPPTAPPSPHTRNQSGHCHPPTLKDPSRMCHPCKPRRHPRIQLSSRPPPTGHADETAWDPGGRLAI